MNKEFLITVYGKAGCPKCTTLNKRLDKLLKKDKWQEFDKAYCDVESETGLVEFCKVECMSPNSIPGLTISILDKETKRYQKIRNKKPGRSDDLYKKSKLYTYLGIQTDYSESGRGLITPKMLEHLLSEALSLN